VSTRKPILIVDDSDDSRAAIELFIKKSIDYVEYRLDKFAGLVAEEEVMMTAIPLRLRPPQSSLLMGCSKA
jgi:hypoxanthine phosphoribosyltransferase